MIRAEALNRLMWFFPLTRLSFTMRRICLRSPLLLQPGPPDISFVFVFVFLRYAGLSLLWPLPLRSTGSGRAGSAAMAHGPSRSVACGIFPDRGTNPRPLHRQADSQPLRHQGSPTRGIFISQLIYHMPRRVLVLLLS